MDGNKCILQLRGVRPFLSNKYDITKHKNYKYLSDADRKNAFDVAKYLSTHKKPTPDEEYQVFEYEAEPGDESPDGELYDETFPLDGAFLPDEALMYGNEPQDLEPI